MEEGSSAAVFHKLKEFYHRIADVRGWARNRHAALLARAEYN